MSLTTDRNDPQLKEGQKNATGQHEIYLVLSEEERAKGFVRPVRNKYIHRGKKIDREGTLQTLDEHYGDDLEYKKQLQKDGYVAFLKYPESKSPAIGRILTQKELDNINSSKEYAGGCGVETRMGDALSETYAANPKFYGATFCCGCNKHLPVNEFIWSDTDEEVGS